MRRYRDLFPELYFFLAGSFHQDWVEDYDWKGEKPSFQRIVNDFKSENPKDITLKLNHELKKFLELEISEDNLYKIIVHDLGANVNVSHYQITHKKWLETVLSLLRN